MRIVLADDHPALIRGLLSLFESDGFEIVGTAATATGLSQLVAEHRPDIAITDLNMPGEVFPAIVQAVKRGTRVIAFTAHTEPRLAFQALEAGALGFVLKGRPADELLEAVEVVRTGELFFSPEIGPRILSALRARADRPAEEPSRQFSARERQIIDGLLRARTNKEIARELNLSEKTIKHYMTNLMAKLGAKNRLDVVLAIQGTPLAQRTAPELLQGQN